MPCHNIYQIPKGKSGLFSNQSLGFPQVQVLYIGVRVRSWKYAHFISRCFFHSGPRCIRNKLHERKAVKNALLFQQVPKNSNSKLHNTITSYIIGKINKTLRSIFIGCLFRGLMSPLTTDLMRDLVNSSIYVPLQNVSQFSSLRCNDQF